MSQSTQEAIAELIAAKNQAEQSLRSAAEVAKKYVAVLKTNQIAFIRPDELGYTTVLNSLNEAIAIYTEQEQKGERE